MNDKLTPFVATTRIDAAAEAATAAGIADMRAYLETLRETRPSVALAAARSAKGGATLRVILLAAQRAFVRAGHAGLSMRMVAEEAGIALGNLSYYFPTKHELLEAMLNEELAEFVEAHLRELDPLERSPLEILLNIVTFYVSNARTSHALFFQIWGYAASDPKAKALVRELYRPIGRFILSLVKAANPAVDDTRARQIVLQIFSLEEGVKLFIGIGPESDPALATAERDIRDLARAIITGA